MLEEKKNDLLFPHDEVRKFQEDLILDVEKTISAKGKLVADAPTGLGKTASALGPALSMALKNNLTVWFLTNRHTQHRLAVDTLKLIGEKFGVKFSCVDLIGKRWMCNQEVKDLFASEFQEFCRALVEKGECEFLNRVKEKGKLSVEGKRLVEELCGKGVLHNAEVLERCKEEKCCAYEIALELGKKARVVIGDYNYVFDPFVQQMIFGKMEKNLEEAIVIVDEAHNLPGRIVEMWSSRLTNNVLRNAVLEAEKHGFDEEAMLLRELEGVLEEMNSFDKEMGKERLAEKAEFVKRVEQVKSYEEILNSLQLVGDEIRKLKRRSYVGGVALFLETWLGEDDGFTRIVGEKEGGHGKTIYLSYNCLDPGIVTKGIFEKVHAAVLMSGTLNPTEMYNDVLAVSGVEKEYPNPFPGENKLTMIVPETSTKYNLRGPEMFKQIAAKLSGMLELIPGNCAVFFPSYYLRDVVGDLIVGGKKKFWEKPEMNKEEREVFLEGFKAEKDAGGILLGVMGGSFGEGVDLPGDLLQGVIVVGVPLGRPDLKTREVMKYYDEKFGRGWDYGYLFPAMNKCFQSAGRCIRSSTDKGVVIYLDERFSWANYFRCFPREGLIVSKDYEKLLKEFFGG